MDGIQINVLAVDSFIQLNGTLCRRQAGTEGLNFCVFEVYFGKEIN
jgi:hypothetical protein